MNSDPKEAEKPQRTEQPRRMSFLLRMWCADENGHSNWRASLEIPETGERLGFANLEQLFIYLIDLSDGVDGVPDRDHTRAGNR